MQPTKNNALGEAMGVLVVILMLLPLAAITVRGAIEIISIPALECKTNGK